MENAPKKFCKECKKKIVFTREKYTWPCVFRRTIFCSLKCALTYRNREENPARKPEARKKISEYAKKRGVEHMHTSETLQKRIKTISGSGHWNWQGNKTHPKCIDCGIHITFKKKRCKKCFGKSVRGEKHPNWKGGVSPKNVKLRMSVQGKKWRKDVFKRDDYTCQICGKRGGELNADHIEPFSLFPELRFDIKNGRTLCRECHKTTETYGGKFQKYLKDFKSKYPNHPYFQT